MQWRSDTLARALIGGLAGLASTAAASASDGPPPRLALPIACEIGRTCFVQHHVDLDPGPAARDPFCGHATYDGHTGVDFRVLSASAARKGVDVLAPAAGVVKAVRDGMADAFARETGTDGIAGRECGNGVVIDHGGGWETQLCHLRQGSVAVTRGQRLTAGTRLGHVGWSGLADFAHVHIVVRKDNAVVDPFTRDGASEACANTSAVDAGRAGSASGSSNAGSRIAADGLWLPEVASSLGYKPGEIFQIGFAARQVTWQELEVDHEAGGQVTATSPALVLFARLSHLKANDRLRFTLEGPGFTPMDQTAAPLPRNQSVYAGFAGRRLTGARWAAGTYRGATEIIRDGQVIARKEATLSVPE